MKRILLVLVVALALGGVVGALMVRDPGYVLLAYDQMAMETSLWVGLLLLAGGYLLIWLVVRLAVQLAHGRGNLRGWANRRRARAAAERAQQGQLLLAEGRWDQARKLLEGAAPQLSEPLLGYLGAARAAHEQGDLGGRDRLLQAARAAAPQAVLAIGLTQAELQQSAGQWPSCRATLEQLQQQAPRHPQVLRLLAVCLRQLHDWQALLTLLPELEKRHVFAQDALLELQLQAWHGRLAAGEDAAELWRQVPKALKRQPPLVAAFARALHQANHSGEAENLLRTAIGQSWSEPLLHLYGTLMSDDPGKQRVTAEGWLKQHPNDPDLLLALGRISLMNRLWDRAREYLEASLRQKHAAETQAELGRLCLALGDSERGGELLSQALTDLPPLPLPARGERSPALAASATHSGRGA